MATVVSGLLTSVGFDDGRGRCMVCGEGVQEDDPLFHGDRVHYECAHFKSQETVPV